MSNKSNGKYFLEPRGKKGLLSICWYDKRSIQRRSTGTADWTDAETERAKFVLKQTNPEHLSDSTLFNELGRYWEQYGKNLASAKTQADATRNAAQVWPKDIKLKELARDKQIEFITFLRKRGLADSTIDRRLRCLFNALSWSERGGYINYKPKRISSEDWKPNFETEEKLYTIEQLAALFNACGPKEFAAGPRDSGGYSPDFSKEHCWRFMVLAIGTAARQGAIRELCWPQIRDNAIQLNPPGRVRTKKRRAIVPMGNILAREIESWGKDGMHVMSLYGNPIKTDQFFRGIRRTAGVGGSPNFIRHTVRTWFAQQGIRDAEADIFVGHAEEGSATGRRFYKHLKTDYLVNCAKAIDALFLAIAPHLKYRTFAEITLEEQPLPEATFPAFWPTREMHAGQMQDK